MKFGIDSSKSVNPLAVGLNAVSNNERFAWRTTRVYSHVSVYSHIWSWTS